MVWQTVFSFLKGLKGKVQTASGHHELADLMSQWQLFEISSIKDQISDFAKDIASDSTLSNILDKAIGGGRPGWVRDSIGLWSRIHALIADGEISSISREAAERMKAAVSVGFKVFERDHGGHPHFIGAFYAQHCVGVLCAQVSGTSTKAISAICRRAGLLVVKVAQKWYSERVEDVRAGVKERLPLDFVEAVSSDVWGDEADPVLEFFWPSRAEKRKASAAAAAAAAEEKWICVRCTFLNPGTASSCEMCGSAHK